MKFLVLKDVCTDSPMVGMTVSDLASTETEVHKHRTTSTLVEIGLQDIPGYERRLYKLHDSENDFV